MADTTLVLYADGCCLGNGKEDAHAGVGVWHAQGSKYNVYEPLSNPPATNQRAELTAAIRALEVTGKDRKRGTPLEIRSDSEYLIKGYTQWLPKWKKNGWKTSEQKSVCNASLWRRIDKLVSEYPEARVTWTWVKGHATEQGNIEADKLAKAGAEMKEEETTIHCDYCEKDRHPGKIRVAVFADESAAIMCKACLTSSDALDESAEVIKVFKLGEEVEKEPPKKRIRKK